MRLSNITDILKKKFLTGVPLLTKSPDQPLQSTFRNHQGLVGFARSTVNVLFSFQGKGL